MAMAIAYNWLFQWDYTFYKWGDLLVLIITDISGHKCRFFWKHVLVCVLKKQLLNIYESVSWDEMTFPLNRQIKPPTSAF